MKRVLRVIGMCALLVSTAAPWGGIPTTAAASPAVMSFHAYLKASNTDASDEFGSSIAVSGDTVVVGAVSEDSRTPGDESDDSLVSAGAAYVYVRTGTAWSQQAYLKASHPSDFDGFGRSVAISGDTIVVGSAADDSGIPGDPTDDSVGDSGAAYVFVRNDGVWSQQAYLKAPSPDALDIFGISVAISGNTIVVGAAGEDSAATGVNGDDADHSADRAGAAYVFTRSGSAWSSQAYLKASNTDADDAFGRSVAVDGDTIAVGAPSEASGSVGAETDNSADGAGAAYVFRRTLGVWAQDAYLKAAEPDSFDLFGASLGVSGDTLVVGGYGEDSAARSIDGDAIDDSAESVGAAWVFVSSGGGWSQQAYLKASNADASDEFGKSVAIDGDTVVVGADFEDAVAMAVNGNRSSDSATSAGAAYVFSRSDGAWSETSYLKASNTDASDRFGASVAVNDALVAVGAIGEASATTVVNGDAADDTAAAAGAAYVYGAPCASAPFGDVSVGQAFCAEIEWMKQTGVSTGFPGNLYKPSQAVTRQAMSAFMARLAGATLSDCDAAPFSDVAMTHPFCREIQWMRDANISTGFDDGTYRPSAVVTRQAMSAFMARLAGAVPPPCVDPPFSDVPVDHPFCEEIAWMKDSGISTGFNDGTYRPALEVTRQAMSAFMYRLGGLLPVS